MSRASSGVRELTTVQEYNEAKGKGFVLITDYSTGNKVHRWDCPEVAPGNFHEKVVIHGRQNGRYYQADRVVGEIGNLPVSPCEKCKP